MLKLDIDTCRMAPDTRLGFIRSMLWATLTVKASTLACVSTFPIHQTTISHGRP